MRNRRGFTLLEILIVVSILALLLSLLFPAFRYAKISAARGRCLANLRQIGIALQEYAALNSNKLPPGGQPFSARDPNGASRYLNSYMSGDGYRALECPADEGSQPGSEYSRFDTDGSSYYYLSGGQSGMSQIVGQVSWQEYRLGEMVKLDIEKVRSSLGYYGNGPEEILDPEAKNEYGHYLRARDITRQEIDEIAWPHIRDALESMAGQEAFNINSSKFLWYRTISVEEHEPDPDPPAPQNPRYKWRNQYNAADGMPISIGSRNTGRWVRVTPWSRPVDNYSYWRMASKKISTLDGDATYGYVTPGNSGTSVQDRYPRLGKGFWHQYVYVPDPADPTDRAKYRVRCHAAFLDGHAAPIEVNKYTEIDRDAHDYY